MAYPQSSQSSTNIENINPNIDFYFEENSISGGHYVQNISETRQIIFFQELKELGDLTNKGNLIRKYLPKQTDIDKILEVIQGKVLKGTHLLVKMKEIQAGYLHSSYFKDLYLYLLQNKLPSSKVPIKTVETLAKIYFIGLTIIQN